MQCIVYWQITASNLIYLSDDIIVIKLIFVNQKYIWFLLNITLFLTVCSCDEILNMRIIFDQKFNLILIIKEKLFTFCLIAVCQLLYNICIIFFVLKLYISTRVLFVHTCTLVSVTGVIKSLEPSYSMPTFNKERCLGGGITVV